jgi:Pentapeptide repeats (8 copies)
LYDATLISDVIERKAKLYLSFNHSIMTESILGGLDLTKASLVDTNLDGSGLKGTILSGANLIDSSLVGADLTDADLTSATLTKANLENANLTRTDISNARGITSKQISETCYWEEATGIAEKLKPKARPLKKKVNACDNMWRRK